MTVELKEFVTKTLSDIRTGVIDAQKEGCVVRGTLAAARGSPMTASAALISVKFDVAVTVEATDAAKMGGGFKVAVLGIGTSAGSDLETASKNTAVSRIQFDVPLEIGGSS
jgi:hypothetical protein